MNKLIRYWIGAMLLVGPGLVALAQVTATPPAAGDAATASSRPAAVAKEGSATAPASTLPSAQSVLEGLLNDRPSTPAVSVPNPAATNPALTPAVEATAPNEPKANRIR